MGMAKKGRGHDFDNSSTGSECWNGFQLVISGVKSLWQEVPQCAKIIPFGSVLLVEILGFTKIVSFFEKTTLIMGGMF